MGRWFRMYDEVLNDPKVQRLPGEKFKAWVNLLCLASKGNGVLPPLVDLAFALRMSEERVASLLNEFYASRLLDETEVDGAPMSYTPHNWNGRQFRSDVTDPTAADRMRRYRSNKRNDRNATVTVIRPETETETEQKEDAPAAGAAHSVSDPPTNPEKQFFDQAHQSLGKGGRSLAGALLKAKGGNVALAHSALLVASQKSNPREYLGAIIRGRGDSPEDLRARGEAW
jgi:hypothetical protein